MTHSPEILAIIPARGGSKGIPRKNVIDLCGKPLIAYSILAARTARSVTRITVSTDDEEIAAVSREWGAEVPFLRPKFIAGDRANVGDAFDHMLDGLKRREGYEPDFVMQLYPTHPFRTPALLDELCALAGQGYHGVWTVRPMEFDDLEFLVLDADNGARPVFSETEAACGRDHGAFRKYGLAAVTTTNVTRNRQYYYPITDPASLVDIDEPMDLLQAECIIRNNLFDFQVQ